jgi:hypothetical protein
VLLLLQLLLQQLLQLLLGVLVLVLLLPLQLSAHPISILSLLLLTVPTTKVGAPVASDVHSRTALHT